SLEGGVQIVRPVDVDSLNLDPEITRSLSNFMRAFLAACRRVVNNPKALSIRQQLFQQFNFLRVELGRKNTYTCHVGARLCQAGGPRKLSGHQQHTRSEASRSRFVRPALRVLQTPE